MKITDLTERELAGITYQAAKDGAPGIDPLEWFIARASHDAEVMAKNADLAEPLALAEKIAKLADADKAEIAALVDSKPEQ